MATRLPRPSPRLVAALEGMRQRYAQGFLDSDPVRYVHRYEDPADREIVAFLAASLAFGRVAGIFASLDDLFARLGSDPARTVADLDARRARRLLAGFRHRWIGEDTLSVALLSLRRLRREHGSLEEAFVAGDSGGADLGGAIDGWAAAALPGSVKVTRALRFLFPSPQRGSACKRMNLFLRWMVRPADGTDTGQWTRVDRSRLVIPLDTHVAFMGRALGLTRRKTANWKMAAEITAVLRRIDPLDPVKFDWALSRPGILGACLARRDARLCPPCAVRPWCRPNRAVT